MKSARRESMEICDTDDNSVYYTLTLDPSLKDHRVIALLIDYTSRSEECPFYRPEDAEAHCSIAPEFTIMWRDCGGKCFVGGLTCTVIVDHLKELEESDRTRMSNVE